MLMGLLLSWWATVWATAMWPSCQRALSEKPAPVTEIPPENAKSPAGRGFSRCAEEDSNLHPVIPDQALNLARLPIPPSARGLAEYSRGSLPRDVERERAERLQ